MSYNCDLCGAAFPEEFAARKCESMHVPVDRLKIVDGEHSPSVRGNFWVGSEKPLPPARLIISWGNDSFEFASYRMDRIGPEPV